MHQELYFIWSAASSFFDCLCKVKVKLSFIRRYKNSPLFWLLWVYSETCGRVWVRSQQRKRLTADFPPPFSSEEAVTQQLDWEESRMLSPHPPRNHGDSMHQPSAHTFFFWEIFSFQACLTEKWSGLSRSKKRESSMMARSWIPNCTVIQMSGFDSSLAKHCASSVSEDSYTPYKGYNIYLMHLER